MPMMAMTTSNSIKVKARRECMPDKTSIKPVRFKVFSAENRRGAKAA
jgi:hypothetical protein